MSAWPQYYRARAVFWALFQNLHNRSRSRLQERKVKDLIARESTLRDKLAIVVKVLEDGDEPMRLKGLLTEELVTEIHKATYAEAARAFGHAAAQRDKENSR